MTVTPLAAFIDGIGLTLAVLGLTLAVSAWHSWGHR